MNIVYIHTHDSGRVLGPYGYAVATPYLNALAQDSLLFKQAYCVSPTCSPSRAALLTGMYPHQNGMLGLAQRGFELDVGKHLVPYLHTNGFQSVLCGIQHEAGWYLDHQKGAEVLGYDVDLTMNSQGYRQEDLGIWDKENAKQVCSYLHHYDQKKPLFLSYGLYATHRRYPDTIAASIHVDHVLPPYPIVDCKETRLDHARYMTSAMQADECIGEVIQALKDTEMYEDSIIFFTTDHGLANPFSKCTLFDSGIGVSLIMRTPGMQGKGRVIDTLVSQIDIFPTLCELLSLTPPSWLEGISFKRYFEGCYEAHRSDIFAEVNFHTSYEPIRCIRDERYKYIRYYDPTYLKMNLSNIDESVTKDYYVEHDLNTYVKYEEALYDTMYDVGECRNRIHDTSLFKVRDRLIQRMNRYMEKTCDPLLQGELPVRASWKVNKKECRMASSTDKNDYISSGR